MRCEWLRRPTNGVAITFVHGLLSSAEASWRHANGTYWPALVAQTAPEVGVYVFSYRTDVFSGTYRLGDAVDALKEQMRLDGLLDCHTLVFVAHSMGGLVVRKLIVERQADFLRQAISLGLFLVASPSLGSRYANLVEALAGVLGHTQVSALRFSQTNGWLLDLDKAFQNLVAADELRIVGKELVEDRFVALRPLRLRPVVEPFSGARYFGEAFKVPGSDHFSISAPEGPEAIQHRLLLRFIADMWPKAEAPTPHAPAAGAAGRPLDLDDLVRTRIQDQVLSLRLDRRAQDHIRLVQQHVEACLAEIGALQGLRAPAAWIVGELIQNVFEHNGAELEAFEVKLDRTRAGLLISIVEDRWSPFELGEVLKRAGPGSFMQMMHGRGLVWHQIVVEGRRELGLELPADLDLATQWAPRPAAEAAPERAPTRPAVLARPPFGRVDELTWEAFGAWLSEAVSVARAQGAGLVLDLASLQYMSSRGLRALTIAKREAGDTTPILLAGPSGGLAEVLAISRYDKLFPVHPDVESALAALGGGVAGRLE